MAKKKAFLENVSELYCSNPALNPVVTGPEKSSLDLEDLTKTVQQDNLICNFLVHQFLELKKLML